MTIIADTTDTRHDPVDEMSALYLDAHPEVRNLIPGWAENVSVDIDGDDVHWTYKIERGEVEVAGIVSVDSAGEIRTELPIVWLPHEDEDWQQEPAHLIGRLKCLAADLNSIVTKMQAGA